MEEKLYIVLVDWNGKAPQKWSRYIAAMKKNEENVFFYPGDNNGYLVRGKQLASEMSGFARTLGAESVYKEAGSESNEKTDSQKITLQSQEEVLVYLARLYPDEPAASIKNAVDELFRNYPAEMNVYLQDIMVTFDDSNSPSFKKIEDAIDAFNRNRTTAKEATHCFINPVDFDFGVDTPNMFVKGAKVQLSNLITRNCFLVICIS